MIRHEGRAVRILLIEDERDMASWLMRALKQSGFVPDRFVMAMTADRKTTRTCQVMWRRGAYIGVWFAPADRAGLANAKAPLVHRQRHSFMYSRA